jgi:uncharacterized protein YcnI
VFLPRFGVVAALLAAFLAAFLAVGVGSASAHVSVSSTDAQRGGFGTVTFTVPNESDTASTVSVRIQMPQNAPLAFLSVKPVPGWTVIRTESDLPKPVTVEGQEISTYTSVVEFRADKGSGIGPGQFQEFELSGGPFPDAASVAFNAVQKYSDGTEVAWIEPTVAGQAEPEHPAPVLTLTKPAASSTPAGDGTGTSESSSGPDALTLTIAIVALVVALGAAVLAWRGSRRTVSS